MRKSNERKPKGAEAANQSDGEEERKVPTSTPASTKPKITYKPKTVQPQQEPPRADGLNLKRAGKAKEEEEDDNNVVETPSPTGGSIGDRVVDFAFNASREKIREVTIVDRIQGKLLPQLDTIDSMWQYVLEVAIYRYDAAEYAKLFKKKRPIPPAVISDFTYRTAQWQKSIQGLNLKSAVDLALAEMESKAGEGDGSVNTDAWKED